MNRRELLRRAVLLGTASAAGLGGYTWGVEPHWHRIVRRDLPISKLPPGLTGARLVQLSDLHVGPEVDDGYLIDALRDVALLQGRSTFPDGRRLYINRGLGYNTRARFSVRPEITLFTLRASEA